MGIIYSLLGWSASEDEPDPILGLTPREIKRVKVSWARATADPTKLGANVMMSLFDKYPEYKKLFPFKDVPDEELKNNMKFKVHCSSVVYNLNQIIDSLDNSELVLGMLDKLATNHIKHNAPHEGFLNIQGIIEDVLRPLNNDEEMKIWSKLLTVAMNYASNKMVEEKKN
ncbi:globin-1-like isoform X2 [Coccinella septempunctata]|uniref:globin-1-like isoform X2 n=1 Tax=Coccinella septempunctata TaxID=41139 RepID=UPI001D060ADF|nr:globin-1-like isoform X2 [Coccinella septempunctata]